MLSLSVVSAQGLFSYITAALQKCQWEELFKNLLLTRCNSFSYGVCLLQLLTGKYINIVLVNISDVTTIAHGYFKLKALNLH